MPDLEGVDVSYMYTSRAANAMRCPSRNEASDLIHARGNVALCGIKRIAIYPFAWMQTDRSGVELCRFVDSVDLGVLRIQ